MKGAIAIRKCVQTLTLDTAVTNILTSAFQSMGTLLQGISAIEVFNPSGSPLLVSTGGSNLVVPMTIPPGGTDTLIPHEFPAGQTLNFKAVGTALTSGIVIVNLFG